ncbi:MAG: 3-hydroxyacyl-CoA dehydrogenase family protein [Bacteroidota bacterium]
MKLAVIADEPMKEAFLSKQRSNKASFCFVDTPRHIPADTNIVFDLLFEPTTDRISLLKQFLPRPVFINAVNDTLSGLGQPFIRINAWPGFFKRDITETVAWPGQEQQAEEVFNRLGWRYQAVPDITGMISPRIIGMIINEAYHMLQEEISTKVEIDIAMKLGTNYPFGPFEWGRQIGLSKVYTMLSRLTKENKLYEIATLLEQEFKEGVGG